MKKLNQKTKSCTLIQWTKLHIVNGKSCCPKCGKPAGLILGIFANPCWAHKPSQITKGKETI